MDKHHPENPFEPFADDVVVHCKTKKQSKFVLKQISERLAKCKLELPLEKTKIVNLRGKSEERYQKKYYFLGFTIKPQWCKINGRGMLLPSNFICNKTERSKFAKFKAMEQHKRRIKLEELAKDQSPIIRGIINYYGKFSKGHLRRVCNQLNARLQKWVKWEKGLYKMSAVKWLQGKFIANRQLIPNWELVNP